MLGGYFIFSAFGDTQIGITLTSQPSLEDGLVGHWTFDGKDMPQGQVNDRSGNGNHGSMTNMSTSTAYAEGVIGQALKFDGSNDYVLTGLTSSAIFTDATSSIAYWARSTSQTFSIAKSGLSAGFFLQNGGANSIQLKCGGCINGNRASDNDIVTNDGQWHHFVALLTTDTASASGNSAHIYIDGELHDGTYTQATAPYVTDGSNPLIIGARIVSPSYFSGAIDDVRVYNRALSADEIRALYQLGQ